MNVALLFLIAAQSSGPSDPPAAWVCEPAFFADGVCDCGCGDVDDDCSEDIACQRTGCPAGTTLDDNRTTCTDPEPDEEPVDDGCAGSNGASNLAAVLLAFPLVLRRRRG